MRVTLRRFEIWGDCESSSETAASVGMFKPGDMVKEWTSRDTEGGQSLGVPQIN